MRLRQDLKSKLVDGLLLALLMVLFSMLLILLVRPMEVLFGRPGLFVYTVVVLALAMLTLEGSMAQRHTDERKAAWGLLSGLLTWTAVDLANMLGNEGLATEKGVISLMLVGTVVGIFWRRSLPIGAKYGAAALLTAWVAHLVLFFQAFLSKMNPDFSSIQQITGFIAIGISVLTLAWIWWESKTTFQRLWGGLILWQCIIIVINVFRGGLY